MFHSSQLITKKDSNVANENKISVRHGKQIAK